MNNRKLFIRLKGGLGNQLFIYSYGIYCEKFLKLDVKFDIFSGYLKDVYGSKPRLEKIGIRLKKTKLIENILLTLGRKNYIKYVDYKNIDDLDHSFEIKNHEYLRPLYLEGYFQDIKYFKSIETTFYKSIDLSKIKDNSDKFNIDYNNSVCIHHRIEFYEFNIDKNYFLKSFKYFEENIKNPIFYVFSDSINLSKNYFKDFKKINIVFLDRHKDIEDLLLMSKFKNFILTIGTFGIWAALLSKKKSKTIVRPYKNITRGEAYPDSWKKF